MYREITFNIVLLWTLFMMFGNAEETKPPHIIFIYADDLGWNDVSVHGSPETPTPNIDSLALNGVLLHGYYGEYMCTPSRAALLTGKYPIRTGLQHLVIRVSEKSALPLNETILPQHLKRLGYSTHMIGKWHLGSFKRSYFPTNRGFDSFFGFLWANMGYYDYIAHGRTLLENRPVFVGMSLYNDTTPVTDFRGQYATHVFTDRATEIISNHDKSKPLFLYLSHMAVHTGNDAQPLEAPYETVSKFKHIKNIDRRIFAGMVSTLDDSVGSVIKALHDNGMLENSIVVFASDNGAEVRPGESQFSSNYPLRGAKRTPWEGGVRVPAMIWSPLLELRKPRISNDLMHVSDWLPTLYRAAGGDPSDLGEIDGFDQWETLKGGSANPRDWVLHTLDPVWGMRSLRKGRAKMVQVGVNHGNDQWYGRSGFEDIHQPQSMSDWVFKDGSQVRDILNETGHWIVQDPDEVYSNASVQCQQSTLDGDTKCDPTEKPCLFFIDEDPCEMNNVADNHPEIVEEISNLLSLLEEQSVPPQNKNSDPKGDPLCFNFTYVPWLEPEYISACDFTQ